MILGVDHLALSCRDLPRAARLLEGCGWQVQFQVPAVVNHPGKRALLADYSPTHGLALCLAPTGIPIELTRHGPALDQGPSPYQVLFTSCPRSWRPDQAPAGENWGRVWSRALGRRAPVAAVWPDFEAQFWFDESQAPDQAPGIGAVLSPSPKPNESRAFWQEGLGLGLVAEGGASRGPAWAHLRVNSVLRRGGLDLLVARGSRGGDAPRLDRAGFPCLALFSNRLAQDSRRARDCGGRLRGEAFFIEVNQRRLEIQFLEGPGGELVELVALAGGERRSHE